MFAEPKKELKPFVKLTRLILGIELQMVYLPPGTVILGDDGESTWIEKGFLLSAEPITQALYRVVMSDNPSYHKRLQLPVESVSWLHSALFCNQLSKLDDLSACYQAVKQISTQELQIRWQRDKVAYRLPTEAEW